VFGDPLGRFVTDPRHSGEEDRFVLLGIWREKRLLTVMFVDRGETIRIISARPATQRGGERMKKTRSKGDVKTQVSADEILPEYDFRKSQRNPYASRYAAGSSVVVLEPDVAAAFPTAGEANEALRALAALIHKHRRVRSRSSS
jgi:hypothetical protein